MPEVNYLAWPILNLLNLGRIVMSSETYVPYFILTFSLLHLRTKLWRAKSEG